MAQQLSVAPLPFSYKAFFLYIEPVATAVGAYYAWFQQDEYMRLTYSTAADVLVSPANAPSYYNSNEVRTGSRIKGQAGTYVGSLPHFPLPRDQISGSRLWLPAAKVF